MEMRFVDACNQPWPGGTVLKDPCTLHEGIVAYKRFTGEQVIIHKSRQIGRAAVTLPSYFTDGKCKLVATRTPQSLAEGEAVVQRAFAEAQSATPWTLFDNCEDFVSRAYTGQGGSATRNLIAGFLAVVGLCVVAVGAGRS